MATLNYAQQWSNELIDILIQGSLASPFITQNVRWLDAKTFHFTQMSTDGYKNHKRDGGWNRGAFTQTDVPFTVSHDRDVEFLVDKADVDETNAAASIQNISKVFEQTHAVPETDALFFSKVAEAAEKVEGSHSETELTEYTPETAFGKLKKFLGAGKLRRYKAAGTLMMYVRSEIMDALEQSKDFTRTIEMTQLAEGGAGIETRVTYIDGVPVVEVIDQERFCDKFKWDGAKGGFEKAEDGKQINVLIACGDTCKIVPKIASIYFFEPGTHTEGDGYLYQNRSLSDAFVFPNGKDGKVDSVYVDVEKQASEAA